VPKAVRCAIYTRESSSSSTSDFSSCEAQRETCLLYVRAHALDGWVALDERFDDEGFSGASLDRPALEHLLERAKDGEVDCVVIHRLDRLTRSLRDWVTLLEELSRREVGLAVVAGDLAGLAKGADRSLLFNLLAIFAEFERELISDRLRDARQARQAHGFRVAGRPPFGYRPDLVTRQLVPDETSARFVRRMFEMATQGVRPATIATAMNALGATRNWEARTVLRLLRNPVYAGQGSPAIGSRPAPLVSRELFEKVGALICSRRSRPPKPRSGGHDPFFLRGLVVCGRCGCRMTTSSSTALPASERQARKAPARARYYRCRRPPCPGSQVPAARVEDEVLRWLAHPPSRLPDQAAFVVATYGRIWSVLMPALRSEALRQIVSKVEWTGRRCRIVLDDVGVLEQYARLLENDG
jgi:site-specific DNA recombinase